MPSGVDLEALISTKPWINWKSAKKVRSYRKLAARSFNGLAKVGNSTSTKRVGGSSWGDSVKDFVSPHVCSSLLEDQGQFQYSAGQRFSSRRGHGTEETAKVKLGEGYQASCEYKDEGDFSGIELLADAASMEVDDSANNHDLVVEDSLMPKDSDPSGSATPSEACLKIVKSENSSIDITAHGGNSNCSSVLGNSAAASRSLCMSAEGVTKPKVNRQHWDLNTLMDAWEEQYDDTIAGNNTNDVNIEETKLNTVSPDSEKHLVEPLSNHCFNSAGGTPYRAVEKDANERNETKVPICDAHVDSCNQVMSKGNILDNSPVVKLSRPLSLLMSEEQFKSTDTVMKMPIEDYSRNLRDSDEKTSGSDRSLDVTAQCKIPRSPIYDQCKDNRDSGKTPELHGTFIQDDGNCLSSSTITDSRAHLGLVAPSAKHEDNSLAIESTDVTENSSKKCDDLTASVGKMGPLDSAVIQNNQAKMVGGDLPGLHEDGYGSPYEDGELRGSFLYSSEDNEIESERVDYESDGRNGDGSDAAPDYPGIDIAQGFHSLPVKGITGEKSKGEAASSLKIRVNNDNMKGSQLIGRRDEYAPKTPVGKLHSRMEGWSSMDATDGKDGFFIQHCRKPRFGSYPRPERDMDISPPDNYVGRFKATDYSKNEGERDGRWDSRGRCNYNNYSPHFTHTRPRRDQRLRHDPRKAFKYPPKGIQIRPPFMRRSPPVERDEYFFRRMLPEQGNYRDRGRFSHVRNFRDDYDFGPDDDGAWLPPVQMQRYISTRERSFSPPMNPHMPSFPPRMISRSRSRSRTHSPRSKWQRFGGGRRNNRSRSPDFRQEPRMYKMRMMRNFSRPEYVDEVSVSPPPRRNFGDRYIRGRRSPVRVLRYGKEGFRPRRFYESGRRKFDDGDFEAMEFSNKENDDIPNEGK